MTSSDAPLNEPRCLVILNKISGALLRNRRMWFEIKPSQTAVEIFALLTWKLTCSELKATKMNFFMMRTRGYLTRLNIGCLRPGKLTRSDSCNVSYFG